MKLELTASAVLCAALIISGCSSAPTLAVPTGEWENFTQQYQPVPQPVYTPLPVAPVELAQGPITTVYTPNPVVAFTPPPGSTPVKPATPSVMLPVSEKTVPQAPPLPPAVTPLASPGLPALSGSSFGVASAAAVPATMPAATAAVAPPGSVGAKPAIAPLAKTDPVAGKPLTPTTTTPAPAKLVTPVPPSPPVPAVPAPKPLKAWTVSPQNKTIREALAEWSAKEGWTFNSQGRDYWTVPQDFDVVASATFHGDFKDAVRKLIASTELTSTPLQPCFFNSNKALRVIRTNEECSPQASQGRKP